MTEYRTTSIDPILEIVSAALPTVSKQLAEVYTMDAVREFCRRSQFAHRDLQISWVDDSYDYTLDLPDDVEVVGIQSVSVMSSWGERVDLIKNVQFVEPDLLHFTHGPSCCMSFGSKVDVVISISPTPNAEELPIEVERRIIDIASGAIARLAMLPTQAIYNGNTEAEKNRAFNSAKLSMDMNLRRFEQGIASESHKRVLGLVRGLRVSRGYGLV